MEKRGKNKKHTHKFLIFLIIVFLIVGIFLFATRYYLYIKFLLVEDVLVNVETKNPYIELHNGETENASFSFQTTLNIFCKVECETSFRELNNENYTKTKMYVRPEDKITQTYQIYSNKNGEGLDLYRFDISCKSIKSALCPTSEVPTKRNSIISVNHTLNNDEKNKKDSYEKDITLLINQINYMETYSGYFYDSLLEINRTTIASSDINQTEFVIKNINFSFDSLEELQKKWGKQNYDEIETDFREVVTKNNKNYRDFNEINNSIQNKINNYNNIINNLDDIYINITKFDSYVFDNETDLSDLNNTVKSYNVLVKNIENYSSIENKIFLIDQFKIKYIGNIINFNDKIKNLVKKQNVSENSSEMEIFKTELKTININKSKYSLINFNFDIQPQCCLFGKCESCCFNDECRDNNYPIIFLHGHQILKEESPEYSLEALNELQNKIEDYNYLNDGTTSIILDKNDPKIFKYFNITTTFRGSYYYDLFNDPENPVVIASKSDNIDTYAIRLKNLVSVVKEKTGRPKVIIVGYSMGGLVTRRYVQLFGEKDVDKIILIATPNNGISGDVATFCGVVGASSHCNDMQESSIFMSQLNNRETPNIPVYNIIGTGCNILGEDGDGVVTSKSAFLDFANNFYVNSTCNSLFDPLHAQIVDPEKYPEVYNKLVEVLKT